MMPKRALLVGSSFSAAPIFFALKSQNMHVSVCGNDRTDPCHQYADASYFIDYSNPDALISLIAQEKFDFIVPSCNDYAYMSSTLAAERLTYPGFDAYEVALTLYNKRLFRIFTQQYQLPTPKFLQINANEINKSLALNFPLLVKPVDSFSGRGVTKVNSINELTEAIALALKSSRSEEFVVEEFVEGELHSHSAFIQDGKIITEFFADEFCTVYPYQVNCSNHPSLLKTAVKQAVALAIQKLVSLLKLSDGLLHTQFIVNQNQFWIIECMRRCPGDLYGKMITLSTDIDYINLYIKPFINQKLPDINQDQSFEYKMIGRHTISVVEQMASFSFSCNIPSKQTQIVPLKCSGELLRAAPYDKLAILFIEYLHQQQMQEITVNLDQFVSIQTH